MNFWKRFVSLGLVVLLVAAILPPETFHHHEHAAVVCKDNSNHFEEFVLDCDLCSFVIPVFDSSQLNYFGERSTLPFNFKKCYVKTIALSDYSILFYRGPPEIV